MPEQEPPPFGFCCPYREACPHLDGLSTTYVRFRHGCLVDSEPHYEHVIEQLQQELAEARREQRKDQAQIAELKAQLQALHRRQFKGRKDASAPELPAASPPKKRGAPKGHPPWTRSQPRQIDLFVDVPAPVQCPDCQCATLEPLSEVRNHIQEDIVLEPRARATCFRHQLAHCPECDRAVLMAGPGELLGSYIGPAAKATALYLRYQLHVSDRKISQFFVDFFGLKFVPASAYGFERQAVRRGRPLYADLLDKLRSLPVAHADETSWRHNGQSYWVWYGGDDDLAVFLWDAHRSTEAAQKLFGEKFDGVLVADAYASYNGIEPRERQSCLAHIKTKAKEIGQELALLEGPRDRRSEKFCQEVQAWVSQACQEHRPLARGRWRARAAKGKERKLKRRLKKLCRKRLRHPKAENLRQRLLGPEQELLFTCFRRAKVPPTNNQAERSLRPIVIMRKAIQGTRSEKGLENHTVLRSLFETSRRQGKGARDFFFNLFTLDTEQAQEALYRNPVVNKAQRTVRRC